jgi:cytochrome c peroxidase
MHFENYTLPPRLLAIVAILLGSPVGTNAQELAIGWEKLQFVAPVPGSYRLPSLGAAGDGEVLDDTGTAHRLLELAEDKVVAVSFFYRSCCDVNGCPLATSTFAKIAAQMQDDAQLRKNLLLVSLSFDPDRDTPEMLRNFRGAIPKGADWRFLTTSSREKIEPILDKYGLTLKHEGASGNISHRLRVFLIGKERRIRNIYSPDFLHADILINDVKTLLMDERESDSKRNLKVHVPDVWKEDSNPLGLPPVQRADSTQPNPALRSLGKKLFFDRRLSGNGTMSCAMCHIPEHAFTNNELGTSVGMEGRSVRRNAPTLLNVAYVKDLFHDGREKSLEKQVWSPLLGENEMGNTTATSVVKRLHTLADYTGKFEAVFEGQSANRDSVGLALAAYQRSLISGDSPFDRCHFGNETSAMSDKAKRGFQLFTGKANCVKCHTIEKDHALFSDGQFHNTGIGYLQSLAVTAVRHPLRIAPGVVIEVEKAVYAAAAEQPQEDLGRSEVTGKREDRWKYRTPTLRNIALTAPYMHDGSILTLDAVVNHYNRGGATNSPGLSSLIRPLGLTLQERNDLVSFLKELNGADR